MLVLLEDVKKRVPLEHLDIGEKTYHTALDAFAALPADTTFGEKYIAHLQVGIQALRIGKTQEAIDHFLAARVLIPQIRPVTQAQKSALDDGFYWLGIAYWRLAETKNCVECNTCESCIFPIQNGGVHVQQGAAKNAIKYLTGAMQRNSDDLESRWLLNIAYMALGEYPAGVPAEWLVPPKVFESDEEFPRFVNIAAELGIDTFSLSGGAIVDDFDTDGLHDIVVSSTHPGEQMRYFHNDGDGGFSDQTEEAGLLGMTGGLNMIQADYDNDGDLDVLVLRGAWMGEVGRGYPNSLLQNDGHGCFRDVTFDAGLGDAHYPTQTAAWADFDNDGDLDLYVGNEQYPSQLFENDGKGHFSDIARRAGVENNRFAKGVVWGDYNDDRLPDLYVSNLSGIRKIPESEGENRLYRNNGDGTFTDVARELGVVRPYSGFPVWFWDFNNDGILDIYAGSCLWSVRDVAADYLGLAHTAEPDCLYEGDGKGGFREVATKQKLTRVTHPMGANFGDLDNDGFPDFYLGTGYPEYIGIMPNLMFHNLRGKGFADVTAAGGFGHLQKGHGISFADLDNDGDEDVFAELGGAYAGDAFGNALFENPGFGNHWIVIRLVGTESNRAGIGVRIRLDIDEAGAKRSVYKWVNSGGSFGANPLRQHLGVGKAEKIDRLEIFWPTSGLVQQFNDVPVDCGIEITEGGSDYRKLSLPSVKFTRKSRE
jgi:tetratricopeptide (TPR) repeat protein